MQTVERAMTQAERDEVASRRDEQRWWHVVLMVVSGAGALALARELLRASWWTLPFAAVVGLAGAALLLCGLWLTSQWKLTLEMQAEAREAGRRALELGKVEELRVSVVAAWEVVGCDAESSALLLLDESGEVVLLDNLHWYSELYKRGRDPVVQRTMVLTSLPGSNSTAWVRGEGEVVTLREGPQEMPIEDLRDDGLVKMEELSESWQHEVERARVDAGIRKPSDDRVG